MSAYPNILTKRVYLEAEPVDGKRILIDRLWPRGISKEKARIDYWAREIAPSNELRKWYKHDPVKWEEFKTRYFQELDNNQEEVEKVLKIIGIGKVTLVFSSKEEQLNNARALKEYLSPIS